jgi:hypothetical protein
MGQSAFRPHLRRDQVTAFLRELAIAVSVGAAALYVIAEWPIQVSTFIYREI